MERKITTSAARRVLFMYVHGNVERTVIDKRGRHHLTHEFVVRLATQKMRSLTHDRQCTMIPRCCFRHSRYFSQHVMFSRFFDTSRRKCRSIFVSFSLSLKNRTTFVSSCHQMESILNRSATQFICDKKETNINSANIKLLLSQ